MNTVPVFVGLDYHQSSVQVCVMDAAGGVRMNRSCSNHWQVIRDAVASVGRPVRVAIEACTGASDLAQELVDQACWSVDLAHAAYVARMKRQPDKTDYSDARMLADLTRVGYLPRVWLAPLYIRDLRRLVSLRNSMVTQRKNLKLRVSGLLRDYRVVSPLNRWTRPWLAWVKNPATLPAVGRLIALELLDQLTEIQKRIGRVEDQMELFTQDDVIVAFLKTYSCIGNVTAWVLRAAIGQVDRFKNGKQLAHYCGLSPANASSGKRVADAGLVDTGNPLLRVTLIELAHRLARRQERWRHMAQHLKAKSRPYGVIVAAIANRFIRAAFHSWKEVESMENKKPNDRSLESDGEKNVMDTKTGEVLSLR